MSEVAVAFPENEAIAGVIVSRLEAEGIAARIDRGMFGAFLAPQQGQLRVMVDGKAAGRAREIVRQGEKR